MSKKPKPSILDELKAIGKPKKHNPSFFDELTEDQKETLHAIRESRRKGEIRASVQQIMDKLRENGITLGVTRPTFNHWLLRNDE